MARPLIAYVCALIVFAAMDFGWLTLTGPTLYKPALGPIMADKVQPAPAIAFYLIYLAGLVYFAVWPALTSGAWSRATINGALFGLAAYATYDLTNQATLKVWSIKVTLADLAWGAFVSAVAATISFFATSAAGRVVH
jgi:uncharacterized membrane protein